MLYLLDTTVLVDYLRGAPAADRVDALLDRGDLACTTGVNVEEIARGLHPDETEAAHALIRGLIVVPIGAEEGWQAGTWRRQFATSGITLSQSDCLVAAGALAVGATLATGNHRHFPMDEVRVEHWPPGS